MLCCCEAEAVAWFVFALLVAADGCFVAVDALLCCCVAVAVVGCCFALAAVGWLLPLMLLLML